MKLPRSKAKHQLPTGAWLHNGHRYCEVCMEQCKLVRGDTNYWECPQCHRQYPVLGDIDHDSVDPDGGLYVHETIKCLWCGNEWLGRLYLSNGGSHIGEGFRNCRICGGPGETLSRDCTNCSGTGEVGGKICLVCGGKGSITYTARS
jgi:hypothetical protein